MKSKIKLVFCLILFFMFSVSDEVTAKKSSKSSRRSAASSKKKSNRRSAAASSSALGKAKSKKGKSNSKSKTKDKNTGKSGKEKSDGKSKEDLQKEKEIKKMIAKMSKETLELTENNDVKVELACLNKDIDFLMGKDCKFLLSEEIKKDLKDPFFCVYQDRPNGKIESVYDYYFYQNYGVKESSVNQSSTVIKVKNPPKGAGKYYQYLLDGIANKTLKEAKILDFLTEKILDEMTVSATDEKAISAKNVDMTAIAMNESLADIEHCKKETKKVIETCGLRTNQNVKKIIGKSCEEYESLLVKQISKLKADVLDKGQELLDVLKERTVQKAKSDAKDAEVERKLKEAEEEEEEREAERAEKEEEKRKAKAAKNKDTDKKADEKDDEKKSGDSKKDDSKESGSKGDGEKKDESKKDSDKKSDDTKKDKKSEDKK